MQRCIRLRTEYLAFVQSISRFRISINYYLLTMLICIRKIFFFFLFNSCFQFLEARYLVRNALIILYLTSFWKVIICIYGFVLLILKVISLLSKGKELWVFWKFGYRVLRGGSFEIQLLIELFRTSDKLQAF